MHDKIKNVIDALNILITDDSVSVEPRTVGKLNTMKRYLLAMDNRHVEILSDSNN